MRNVLVVIVTFLLSFSAQAEYDGYHISFTIEDTKGVRSKGYAYVAAAYLNTDSLQNTNYLIKALDQNRQDEWDKKTTLAYYKSRIIYNYFSIPDQQRQYEYFLTGEITFKDSLIRKITIIEMIDWGYLSGISMLKTNDFSWAESEPIKAYSFSSDLCSWQILVHEKDKSIERIINKVELLAKEKEIIEQEIDQQDLQDLNNTEELSHKLEIINQAIEEQVGKAIKQLKGYKVAVVTYCTC